MFLWAIGLLLYPRGLFDDFTPKPAALPRSRLLNPSAPPCDQMDHDQHYSDHEQNPGNLHRDR
jgi:hypothetical protein